MGLTRIRAQQISDIDYKQAVRVITLTDITLSGSAPVEVDGVTLLVGDRILVNGQSNAAQNGLYQVQTLGTGSNGTWVRTSDGNEDGEIQPGMVVMVTQGNQYADTPWKLITNGTIIIGTTELVFEENYSLAFGNVFANGTAVVANVVSAPLTLAAGDNIEITGNNTSKTVTIGVTGISLNSIANGTSNVTVVSSGGNVTVGVAGSEVAEFSTVGLDVTGNITGSNIATVGQLKTTGTFLIGTQQFFAQGSDGFSVNENFNAGNATVTAYHYTSGAGRNAIVFDTAVTGQFTTGFGATGNAAQNKFVSFAEFNNTTWEWRRGVGISAPNLNGGTLLANINPDGNLYTLGTIIGTGNITGGNLVTAGTVSAATLSTTGNATIGGNLTVQGNLIYVNVEDLRVEDPVIIMGTGPNGDPLTSDDGQDRGIYMEYYVTDLGNAFVGWQNSSGNLIAASDVSFSANNVISVTEYGTLQAGNLYVESVVSVGNITGDYILGNGSQLTGLPATYGNANVADFLANGFGSNTITTTGNITADYFVGDGTALSGINAFGNIAVSGETTVSADSTSDTLTLVEGTGISITTDAANNVITIGSVATDSIFATGGDMGTITEAVTVSEDLGLITDAATVEYDLGLIVTAGIIQPDSLILPTKTVAQLANLSATPSAQFVYCSDESGGAVPAFSDGTNWRRVTDRAIVT